MRFIVVILAACVLLVGLALATRSTTQKHLAFTDASLPNSSSSQEELTHNSGPTATVDVGMEAVGKMTPSFEEIRKKREELAYEQWKRYSAGLRGTRLEGWHGKV